MRRITHHSALLICLAGLIALGCSGWGPKIEGSGVAKTEQRQVDDFQKVHVNGSPKVNIQVGGEQSLSVTSDDNVLPAIDTVVEGDTLVIGSNQSFSTRLGVTVVITVPNLSGVAVHGSGDVNVTNLDATEFIAEIQGSGDISVAGRTEELAVEIQGSGDVNLDELQAKRAAIEVQGSGDSIVNVSDELTVHVAGSGDVKYKGSPTVTKTVAGSGSVKKVG